MSKMTALDLYEHALSGQWNPDADVDWTLPSQLPPELDAARKRLINELYWSERQSLWTVMRMNTPIKDYFDDHEFSMCAAAHTFDEARHTYVLERYCKTVDGLDDCPLMWRVVTRVADFSGASVVNYFFSILMSETLGEALFAMLRRSRGDDLLKAICERALRDESRHIMYLTEALRRIHPRLGRVHKLALRATLRTMLYFALRSLRRTEADARTLGIGKDEYLDYFERKLTANIRRAGVEDVLSPESVHAIIGHYHTAGWTGNSTPVRASAPDVDVDEELAMAS